MTAVERERRVVWRVPSTAEAYFDRDGIVEKLVVKDFSDFGIGAYAYRDCPTGQQGMLLVKYSPGSIKRYISEVVWCRPNSGPAAAQYPYCVGFKIFT